ncbi:MAG: GGDEF domain-containing protein [Lachnospiraceae bacterium]|nr:GGDEF domain-containing protein [Lachnospiraceae bacterium]
MKKDNGKTRGGLPLRVFNYIVLVCSVAVTVVLLLSAVLTFRAFYSYAEATERFVKLQETADSLMNASDYLTSEARLYTVTEKRIHLENYFFEAETEKNRDRALETMKEALPGSEALRQLEQAMQKSVALMDKEYYAMRIILLVNNDEDIPEAMKMVEISEHDMELPNDEKRKLARRMMHDEEYEAWKDRIRSDMKRCVDSLSRESAEMRDKMRKDLHRSLVWMCVLILLQSAELTAIFVLTTRLGIRPLIKAVMYIDNEEKLPEKGSREFRYLAQAYNKMYSVHYRNMKKLSFKAYHDELTGLYNRAGFDLIVQNLDTSDTAFLLIDSDNFKEINDNNGHDVGDRVLCRIADTLKGSFRPSDYVFRIGGDEFVVLMTGIDRDIRKLIGEKVYSINKILQKGVDDLPPITVSVGVAMCSDELEFADLYRNADEALYKVKENGRNGFSFYSG